MLSIFKLIFKRLVAYPIIIICDIFNDFSFIEENASLQGGYLKLSLKKLGINETNICPKEVLDFFKENSGGTLRDFNQDLLHRIISCPEIEGIVFNYLGKNARVDDFYLKCASNTKGIPAESWHHDNVGYRLKLFCILHIEGDPASTKYIPGSRPNLMKLNLLSDVKRFSNKTKKKNFTNELSINYQQGDLLFFDTNNNHRGAYTDSEGKRVYMCIEFIDKHKSNLISGLAPCGPEQKRGGRLKITQKFDSLSNLFDKKMISLRSDYMSYSIKNRA